jgi:hypothetical protein
MTTLTDRYVWGVLRAIPEAERSELEPEIRALVADAVEARLADGATGADAERAALIELGDPEILAGRYTNRKQFLIGPPFFLAWKRVVVPVLGVVVPIVTIVDGVAGLLGGATPGEIIVSMFTTAYFVAVMILFWVTLVFALLERAGTDVSLPEGEWTPDALPDVPAPERLGAGELIGSVITSVIVATLIVWQQLQPPIVIDGISEPLFDPALWSFWLPWFLVVTLVEVAFTVALYLRGRWTWLFAAVNAALGAAFAIPAIWLIANGLLLNPAIKEAVLAAGGTWLEASATITAVVVAAIVAWDAFDGFRKAYRNTREPVRSLA